jgi:S-layer homology domain.
MTNQNNLKVAGNPVEKNRYNLKVASKVVDVQAIDYRQPLSAVKEFDYQPGKADRKVQCDVLIVGGGLGGVAAALALCMDASESLRSEKLRICLTEETDWLGGQATSQAVSALDENWLVESSGAPRRYQKLRAMIRHHYLTDYRLGPDVKNVTYFDPGSCWVSRLAFEPKVALDQLAEMLKPALDSRKLEVFYRHKALAVESRKDGASAITHIKSVGAVHLDTGKTVEFQPRIVIDATELGDLLPLAGLPYSKGAESKAQTGEAHAPLVADADNVQDLTYPFVVDFVDGGSAVIEKPLHYDEFVGRKQYSLLGYKMFSSALREQPDGSTVELLPFWTYRRLIDRKNFANSTFPNDVSMINWESNDLRDEDIIDVEPETAAKRLARGKALSLGFLFWLQTEVARDDGGVGYPEIKLRTDVLGTADGISKYPYIRESRRIIAHTIVKEEDIAKGSHTDVRARLFADSVGIGHYPIDIHGRKEEGTAQNARPFQIPLSSLIPRDADNLIAGCKNIGVTHITNGAYRLHPIEWGIGTAAGALALHAMEANKRADKFLGEPELLLPLQRELVDGGTPVYWFDDVSTSHVAFSAIQSMALVGLMPGDPEHLNFEPDAPVSRREIAQLLRAIFSDKKRTTATVSDVAHDEPDFEPIAFAVSKKLLATDLHERFRPFDPITKEELRHLSENSLVKLPRRDQFRIAALLDAERADYDPITKSEIARWLVQVMDYKKRWHKLDVARLTGLGKHDVDVPADAKKLKL